MILITYSAGYITRPLSTSSSLLLAMIPVRCQGGQGHIGDTFLLLRFRLLLDLQRDRWSLSVHARLWHRFTTGLTSRGSIFRLLNGSNSSRRRECPAPLPANWVSPWERIECKTFFTRVNMNFVKIRRNLHCYVFVSRFLWYKYVLNFILDREEFVQNRLPISLVESV